MIERMFFAATALYVVVLPISGTTALRSLAFALLLLCTAWQAARGRLRLDFPLTLPWTIYAAVASASLLYAADPVYSLGEIKVEVLYPFLIFVVAASWCRNVERLGNLIWLLVAGNALFVAGSAWTALRGEKVLLGAWDTGVGATATVIVGVLPWIAVLAISMRADGRSRMAGLLALLIVANLAALALTINRQGWVSIGVSFIAAAVLAGRSFWTRPRLLAASVAAGIFLAAFALQFQLRSQVIVGPSGDATSVNIVQRDSRWALWRFSLERITERPWTGGGFGRESFDKLFRDFHLASGDLLWHAHNMVINKGVQMGIPGVAAFLALWLALATACARGLRVPELRPWAIAVLAMMAGIFMRNMVDDFFVRDHALLFWLLCGAYLGTLRRGTVRAA